MPSKLSPCVYVRLSNSGNSAHKELEYTITKDLQGFMLPSTVKMMRVMKRKSGHTNV